MMIRRKISLLPIAEIEIIYIDGYVQTVSIAKKFALQPAFTTACRL